MLMSQLTAHHPSSMQLPLALSQQTLTSLLVLFPSPVIPAEKNQRCATVFLLQVLNSEPSTLIAEK